MNRVFRPALVLVALLALIVAVAPPALAQPAKTVVIKATHGTAKGSSWDFGLTRFKDLVEAKSKGRVKVEIFPQLSLSGGNNQIALKQQQDNVIQMSVQSPMQMTAFDPKYAVFTLPFMFKDREAGYRTMDSPAARELLKEIERFQLKGLDYWELGFRQLTNSRRPIVEPADMKGLKFRVPESKLLLSTFRALGADPTIMSAGEIYTSLQTRTVDGQENPPNVILALRVNEVNKFITLWNYVWDPSMVVFSKKFWDELPPDLQKIVADAVTETTPLQRKFVRDGDDKLIADFEKQGLTITRLSEAQLQKFRDVTKPIYDEYKPIIGADLLSRFMKAAY